MSELLIQQNKGKFKAIIPIVWFTFSFFAFFHFLASGWSYQEGITYLLLALFLLALSWGQYTNTRRKVLINKTTNEVIVYEITFFGRNITKSYSLNQFSSVRSFISPGKGAVNIVELATTGGYFGLELSSFLPSSGGPFFSILNEVENPKAEALRIAVCEITGLTNLGFVGHKFFSCPIESKIESPFFSKLF
jgi:hypothetical protein